MKNNLEYPPLKIISSPPFKEFMSWEQIEQIRILLHNSGRNWHESIYLPTWGISIGIQMFSDSVISPNTLFGASIVWAILISWRRLKEVYRFAPELEKILYGQGDDCKIPVGILQRLPYPCIYLETPNLCVGRFHGFFVFMDQNIEKSMYILRCLGISPTGDIVKNYDLKLMEGATLDDAIRLSFAEELRTAMEGEKNFTLDGMLQEIVDRNYVMTRLLQMVLYICAKNSDIAESRNGRTGTPLNVAVIKDKYREIRVWDLGYRIVNQLNRTVKTEQQQGEKALNEREPSGKNHRHSPRPHMRKSHWHIYWVGKRVQSEREMVIKWVNSTLVNGKTTEELPVTINRYKKEK